MAVGDITTTHSTIADQAELAIQPAAGVEWVIHNLYYGGAMELFRTDGAIDILIDSDTGAGARLSYVYHPTNGVYFKLKNVSGADAAMGFDGVITKE